MKTLTFKPVPSFQFARLFSANNICPKKKSEDFTRKGKIVSFYINSPVGNKFNSVKHTSFAFQNVSELISS